MDITTWIETRDWVATGTWVAAGIAFLSAATTLWWPWHTRPQPKLHVERGYANLDREQTSALIVTCDLQRPFLMWILRNDGDGKALNIKPKDDKNFRLLFIDHSNPEIVIINDRLASLDPATHAVMMFVPMNDQDVEEPQVKIEWSESPIRLKRNHKSKMFSTPGKLPAKSPLGNQEKYAVQNFLRGQAAQYGYSFDDYVELLGFRVEDVTPV